MTATKFPPIPCPNFIDTAHAEKALVRKHVDLLIGRVVERNPDQPKHLDRVFAGVSPDGFLVATVERGTDPKSIDRDRCQCYTVCPVSWGDPAKVPDGWKARMDTEYSNDCVCWHLAAYGGKNRLAPYKPGPRLPLGSTIVGPDDVPVYPHELGFTASPAMLERMDAARTLLRQQDAAEAKR